MNLLAKRYWKDKKPVQNIVLKNCVKCRQNMQCLFMRTDTGDYGCLFSRKPFLLYHHTRFESGIEILSFLNTDIVLCW